MVKVARSVRNFKLFIMVEFNLHSCNNYSNSGKCPRFMRSLPKFLNGIYVVKMRYQLWFEGRDRSE